MGTFLNLAFAGPGLGFVPASIYLALGLVLRWPAPRIAQHLLRLAGAVIRPSGSHVVDRHGRSALALLPGLGATLVGNAMLDAVDPDQLLSNDTDPAPRGPFHLRELVLAAGAIAWLFTMGTWLALFHLVVGLLLCLTVVGALLGVRHFALIPVALAPWAFRLVRQGEPTWGPLVP